MILAAIVFLALLCEVRLIKEDNYLFQCLYSDVRNFFSLQDDKLERLFKMYADMVHLKLESLVFCFDGDKLSPTATPTSAGLENDDIIEVHMKSQ